MDLKRGQQVFILHFWAHEQWWTGIYHYESGSWLLKGSGRYYWQSDRWAQVCGSDYSSAAVICSMCGLTIVGERWLIGKEFPTPCTRNWLTENGRGHKIPELLTEKPMNEQEKQPPLFNIAELEADRLEKDRLSHQYSITPMFSKTRSGIVGFLELRPVMTEGARLTPDQVQELKQKLDDALVELSQSVDGLNRRRA